MRAHFMSHVYASDTLRAAVIRLVKHARRISVYARRIPEKKETSVYLYRPSIVIAFFIFDYRDYSKHMTHLSRIQT